MYINHNLHWILDYEGMGRTARGKPRLRVFHVQRQRRVSDVHLPIYNRRNWRGLDLKIQRNQFTNLILYFPLSFSGASFPCWTENVYSTRLGIRWALNCSSCWKTTFTGSRQARPWPPRRWLAWLSTEDRVPCTTGFPIIYTQVWNSTKSYCIT